MPIVNIKKVIFPSFNREVRFENEAEDASEMLKDRVIFLTHNLDASYTEFLIAHYRLSDLIREYAKSKERK